MISANNYDPGLKYKPNILFLFTVHVFPTMSTNLSKKAEYVKKVTYIHIFEIRRGSLAISWKKRFFC